MFSTVNNDKYNLTGVDDMSDQKIMDEMVNMSQEIIRLKDENVNLKYENMLLTARVERAESRAAENHEILNGLDRS